MQLLLLQDEPEALCYCKETQEACGSDNRTYENVCQMNEESMRSGNTVYLKHWGPCHSGNTLMSIWCYSSTGTSYQGADKSLARPTSHCILFDGENISFDASLVIYINSTNIPGSLG